MSGDERIVEAARELLGRGVAQVMVSLGGDGAVFVTHDAGPRPHAAPARPDTPAYALNWEL